MKVQVTEHDGCFGVCLTAETLPEAALLTRLGMNRTNELRHAHTTASKEGQFEFNLCFGKHKRASGEVPKRS